MIETSKLDEQEEEFAKYVGLSTLDSTNGTNLFSNQIYPSLAI